VWLFSAGPGSFQLPDDPVHTEAARLLPWGKVQKGLQKILRDYSGGADAEHAARNPC